MEDKFKVCSKCNSRMNVLDTHEECYRHRICNKSFPCKFCRTWSDEQRNVVDKMLEKAKSKAAKPSVQETGFNKEEMKLSSVLAAKKDDAIPSTYTLLPENSLCVGETENTSDIQYQSVDLNKFIADQVQLQLQQLLPSNQKNLNDSIVHDSTNKSQTLSTVGTSDKVLLRPQKDSDNRPRTHFSKFLPADDQISVLSPDDSISMIGSRVSDDNNNETISNPLLPSQDHDYSVVGEGAPGASDPIQWSTFLHKLTVKLNIDCSQAEDETDKSHTSYVASRLNPNKHDNKVNLKLPMEGTTIDTFKAVEKEAITGKLKNRSVRLRDDKAFMVSKQDFTEFCSPPRLDDNIEEGLSSTMSNRKRSYNDRKRSSYSLSPFEKEMDSDFKKIDVSARALLRSISYGSLIASYVDTVDSEEDKVEACTALVACFKSMADMTSRIVANSVLSRRKIFLKTVDFQSKATSSKLMNLPVHGPQLFGGKYFDTLHSSAENIRDAKETQNVYRSSFMPNRQKYDDGAKKKKVHSEIEKPPKNGRFDKDVNAGYRQGSDSASNFRVPHTKQGGGKSPFLWKNFSQKPVRK